MAGMTAGGANRDEAAPVAGGKLWRSPRPVAMIRFSLLFVALLVLSGCDLFGGRGDTSVFGRVTDAETGEPMRGVRVSFMDSGGFGIYSTRAFVTTDAEGRYDLSFPYEGNDWPDIRANRLGTLELGFSLISHAGGMGGTVEPGRRTELDIRLVRNSYYDPVGQPLVYPSPVRCVTSLDPYTVTAGPTP